MTVPQYALTMGTRLGELVKWYGFAEKCREFGLCGGTAIAVPYIRTPTFSCYSPVGAITFFYTQKAAAPAAALDNAPKLGYTIYEKWCYRQTVHPLDLQ